MLLLAFRDLHRWIFLMHLSQETSLMWSEAETDSWIMFSFMNEHSAGKIMVMVIYRCYSL